VDGLSPGARVLLTGATDGIGLALAQRWQARGLEPIGVGRRAFGDLGRTPLAEPRYFRADLSSPGAARGLVEALDRAGVGPLDRVVLNAGAGYYGELEAQPSQSVDELVHVNLASAIELVHGLLPRVRAAAGRFTFVSSVASALPVPRFAVYGATKAALEGFARSLRVELAGEVEVQVLRPGATRTGLHTKCGALAAGLEPAGFAPVEGVAEAIDRALAGGPRWRTIGAANALVVRAARAFPRLFEALAARGDA